MAGIGDTLRAERRRQGRSLADAAAETRVRESYLAAIEEEDFGLLGGDVYTRGFIRLYARYLSLDAEALVERYRAAFGEPETVSAFPSSGIDDILPPRSPSRLPLSPPVLAALGVVAILAVLFLALRGGGEEATAEDPNALGPQPAEVAEQPAVTPTEATEPSMGDTQADALVEGPPPAALEGPVLEELVIDVSVRGPVRMTVLSGQPPVTNASLSPGDVRRVIGDSAVVFQVTDADAVDIDVNGLPLAGLGGPGQAVEVSCVIGRMGCDVKPI